MHGPEVLSWLLVSLCVASGAYGLVRSWHLRAERYRFERSALVAGLMGMGMAVMALPARLVSLPPLVFSVFFALLLGWTLLCIRRFDLQHGLHHTLEGCAMIYMALVLHPGTEHVGHKSAGLPYGTAGQPAVPPGEQATGGSPLLTGALLVYLLYYAMRAGARAPALAAGAGGNAREANNGPNAPAGRGNAPSGQGSPTLPTELGLTEACHGILAMSCAVMLLVG